jgi:hypothetical protein
MRKVSFENEKQQIIVAFRTRTLNIAKTVHPGGLSLTF